MSFSPAATSSLMNSAFFSVGIVFASFCNPSRGPTSTMRTLFGRSVMRSFYHRLSEPFVYHGTEPVFSRSSVVNHTGLETSAWRGNCYVHRLLILLNELFEEKQTHE